MRQRTVDYIESHRSPPAQRCRPPSACLLLVEPTLTTRTCRAHFEFFCEEDEPIDVYCERLRKAGEWGGNMEVVAASGHFRVDVAIVSDSEHIAARRLPLLPS